MMQHIALEVLAVCWAAWLLSIVWPRRRSSREQRVELWASRWGIFLNLVGFASILVVARPLDFAIDKPMPALITGMVLAPLSVVMAWLRRLSLSKRWRDDLKYEDDWVLMKTGPFRLARHPSYTAALGMLLATGAIWSSSAMLVSGVLFFITGLELRLYAADRTLANRFQDEFAEYQSRVRGYIPFIR